MDSLRERLRAALKTAMKARDRDTVSALRSTLAAIDNAEAVDASAMAPGALAIEQSPVGVGVAEVERRNLTEDQVAEIVRTEIADREAAARDYDRRGSTEHAELLRTQARAIAALLSPAG